MRFEMFVTSAGGDECDCKMAIYLDPDPDQKDPLTIAISPIELGEGEESWETIIDIDRAKATQLRAVFAAMLEIMK